MPQPLPFDRPEAGAGYRRDLGQHLLLRWSTPADVDSVARLFVGVMDAFHGQWVRTLMSGYHPYCSPDDFALVEDTATQEIIAAANLFANRATYAGIPFILGRAAIVGTEPTYRHRGLQRGIFDLLHARSAARGHLVQGITGIHYFYRQFGYEYAIDLEASRHVFLAALPPIPPAGASELVLRPAQETDLPVLLHVGERECACWQVATLLDEQAWRWILRASDPVATAIRTAYMITTADKQVIGYTLPDRVRGDDALSVWGLSVLPGIALATVAVPILHAIAEGARAIPTSSNQEPMLARFLLEMGPGHALFDALGAYLAPPRKYPYAWWMRIPDVPAYIRHIAPALNDRLTHSVLAGFTGELAITFYRSGLHLVFERGVLLTAEGIEAPSGDEGQAGFPPHIFTHLLLGYHSFADLRHIYKDVWAEGLNRTLLETLFPPRHSYMLPLF